MIRLNIHEAKTHLSRYLALLAPGETIVICRRNQPIAEIRALEAPHSQRRPIGLAKGEFTVPDGFFDPLPDHVVRAFHGDAE